MKLQPRWLNLLIGPELILGLFTIFLRSMEKPSDPSLCLGILTFGVPAFSCLSWLASPMGYWRLARVLSSNTVLFTLVIIKALPDWNYPRSEWGFYSSSYFWFAGPFFSVLVTLIMISAESIFLRAKNKITMVTIVDGILRSIPLGITYAAIAAMAFQLIY